MEAKALKFSLLAEAAAKWDAWSQLAGCQPELAQVSYATWLELA